MSDLIVSVRDGYGTYTAKFGKHRASCTSGAKRAVECLAVKIFGRLQRVEVLFLERIGQNEEEWKIRPDASQRCRVCGCTWIHGCADGCYWVTDDLCSRCYESPIQSGLDRTTSGAIGQP